MQHFLHHLTPRGTAGFVLSNGSMSSNQSGEGEIRKNIIEASLVDCIIVLPGQLFRSTQIPACLWFLRIADTYRAWRSGAGEYADVPGLCKSAALEEIRRHGHVLTPGVTWARSHNLTTANHSRRRWPAWPPNGGSNRLKGSGWTRPSRRTWSGWGLAKARDAIRLVERDGWRLVRSRGSHRQYRYPVKPGRVTIPGKPGDDLPSGTWDSIMKQSGLKG